MNLSPVEPHIVELLSKSDKEATMDSETWNYLHWVHPRAGNTEDLPAG